MSDETEPVFTRESSLTNWFVGIIVLWALACIGYLTFMAFQPSEAEQQCKAANPGIECVEVHRWEPSNV